MGIKRQKYFGNSLLSHGFRTDKKGHICPTLAEIKETGLYQNFQNVTHWLCHTMTHSILPYWQETTSQGPPTKFSATLYNYNIVKKCLCPFQNPIFDRTILSLTFFIFKTRRQFLDMFWILYDICDVFKAKLSVRGQTTALMFKKIKVTVWKQNFESGKKRNWGSNKSTLHLSHKFKV